MTDNDRKTLSGFFLFNGEPVGEGEGWSISSFPKSGVIYCPDRCIRCLGLILSGSAAAFNAESGAVLNEFGPGDVFGAAALFGEGRYGSIIRARGECRVALFEEDYVRRVLSDDPRAALSYIAYLSEKIRFLNRKVSVFTSGSAESKAARYLLAEADGDGRVNSGLPSIRLASLLSLSRASLYRALGRFEQEGAISRNGHEIIIRDSEKLIKYTGKAL